jgi:hypothetical protein
MARLVMKLKQLFGAQGQRGVSPTLVIAELHFVDTRGKSFDNGPNLAALQFMVVYVFKQCDYKEQFEFARGAPQSYSTKQLVNFGGSHPTIQALRMVARRSPRFNSKSTVKRSPY